MNLGKFLDSHHLPKHSPEATKDLNEHITEAETGLEAEWGPEFRFSNMRCRHPRHCTKHLPPIFPFCMQMCDVIESQPFQYSDSPMRGSLQRQSRKTWIYPSSVPGVFVKRMKAVMTQNLSSGLKSPTPNIPLPWQGMAIPTPLMRVLCPWKLYNWTPLEEWKSPGNWSLPQAEWECHSDKHR